MSVSSQIPANRPSLAQGANLNTAFSADGQGGFRQVAVANQGSEQAIAQSANLNAIFGTDSHDGFRQINRFVSEANQANPDLVLLGGDMIEMGTAKEHQAVQQALAGLKAPVAAVEGNHDYKGAQAQRFAATWGGGDRSFDKNGVHFVMIDNADQTISDKTFAFLEQDLKANRGKPTAVVMHVPAVGKAPGKAVKGLNKAMPKTIASPVVKDPAQAKRFTDLMSQYNVDLVLSGHTHIPSESTIGGVRYVTAGAVGGKLPKKGISHEYLKVGVKNGEFSVEHVPLDAPTSGKTDVVSRMGSYFYNQFATILTGKPRLAKSEQGPLMGAVRAVQHGMAGAVTALGSIAPLRNFGYKAYGLISSGRSGGPAIDNQGKLASNLVRGAQPSEAALATLKKQGVKTIINLRPESTWEAGPVQDAGMKYVHLPLPAIGKPTNEQAVQFLKTVTDPANGKAFFHCLHGADRTGAMAAVYRIAAQGWSADKAIAEMPKYHFHAGFEDAKTTFVKQFEGFWHGLGQSAQQDILHAVVH